MQTCHLPSDSGDYKNGFLAFLGENQPVAEIGEFLTIGRDPSNGLVLNDNCISSRHARIEKKANGDYILRDLRSRNGTFLNGVRVVEAQLFERDRIRLGQLELIFSSERERKTDNIFFLSKNDSWKRQLSQLPIIGRSQFPVLILGPSGSGKDVVAQLIHQYSTRHRGPLVTVNCGALSESLIESELFGHVKGSFTGATHDRKGAFESARGGSLFLDEVGELPLSLQPKLLRALEAKEIKPVGADETSTTDVRLIAATHQDLHQLVLEGKFREDLYYRLNVVQVTTLPLHRRMEDFEDLLYYFAKSMRVRFSHAAIEKLKTYHWPGNIRELRNCVARASALFNLQQVTDENIDQLVTIVSREPAHQRSSSVIKEVERDMICHQLKVNHGNQRRTAMDLGIAKSTLHDKIKTYGIDLKTYLAD